MLTFDASSLIYAWHEYSSGLLPPLWRWLGEGFASGEFGVSQVAYDEVHLKSEDCTDFLDEHGVQILPVTAEIAAEAVRIKSILGIANDDYHPKGVGENDLLIIATAVIERAGLVSEEGRQNNLPDVMSKCRIPAVCGLPDVKVDCIRFIELLRASGESFGS